MNIIHLEQNNNQTRLKIIKEQFVQNNYIILHSGKLLLEFSRIVNFIRAPISTESPLLYLRYLFVLSIKLYKGKLKTIFSK